MLDIRGMGRDSDLRESSMSVISRFNICVKCKLHEWQFSLFFVILIEKSSKFYVISSEIYEITEIERKWDFTI